MKVTLPLLLGLISMYCNAQDTLPEIVTDRPDQTESSSVIPVKSLQIETGFIMENDEKDNIKYKSFAYNTTLLRYGLLQQMELRLGLDYLGENTRLTGVDSATAISGFAPLYTGFKIKVAEEQGWRPAIALLGALVLPVTAGDHFKPSHSAANMRFSFSNTLSERLSLGYNLGVAWDGDTVIPEYFYTVSLGIGVSEKIGVYLEVYGIMPEDGSQEHLADAGFTYLLLPNLQLDISGGLGIYNATGNFIGCGLSYRLPR